MSDGTAPAPRRLGGWGAARVIKAILVLQVVMAVILFARDLGPTLPALFERSAPRLTEPVGPGDQTRRYRPADLSPARRPGDTQPFPARTEMPDRLAFETAMRDGEPVVRLVGAIAPGDGERFSDWIGERAEPPARVLLDSPGGSVDDALAIGRQVRDAGIATALDAGAICLSACPYILAGGTARGVAEEAMVGVHQHYYGESTILPAFLAVEDIQRSQGIVLEFLDEMGIDPMVMRHSLATAPNDIYILVREELERYRLVTSEDDG